MEIKLAIAVTPRIIIARNTLESRGVENDFSKSSRVGGGILVSHAVTSFFFQFSVVNHLEKSVAPFNPLVIGKLFLVKRRGLILTRRVNACDPRDRSYYIYGSN